MRVPLSPKGDQDLKSEKEKKDEGTVRPLEEVWIQPRAHRRFVRGEQRQGGAETPSFGEKRTEDA